jgi:NADPH:quinone reductase-like Zn-dependent oxidoreductase
MKVIVLHLNNVFIANRYNPNVSSNNFPVILGRDGAGVIAKCGNEAADNFRPGDRVWFVVPYCLQVEQKEQKDTKISAWPTMVSFFHLANYVQCAK